MDNIDFSFKIGYDDYENSSSKIYIDVYFGAAGIPGDYGCRGIEMRKGDTVHQRISLNSLKDCDPSRKLSRAGISAFYHGNGNFNGKMTIKVSNAKITVGSKEYKLDYLNGTNTLDMIASYNKDYDCWTCYNKIGDTFDSGLPTAADLKDGVFEADMTIVDVNETNRSDKIAYYLTNGNMLAPPKREMIDALKDAGYDAVRLTISYTPFMNNDTFIIDKA